MRKVKTTKVFDQVVKAEDRLVLFQGGSRSGKTYNILIALVYLCLTEKLVVDITRRTLPALKATVLRDLFEVLEMYGIRPEHNKTDRILRIGKSEIAYYSLDEEEKVRGRKRDIIFVNELPEVPEDIVKQLLLRTKTRFIADFNPSITKQSYINNLIDRKDSMVHISTFMDNPFLEQSIVNEILALRHTDEWMWKVFGLGLISTPKEVIYQYTEAPQERGDFMGFGLDFGFSDDPTALIGVWRDGKNLYIREYFYLTNLTTKEIADELYRAGVRGSDRLVCDNSEPRLIRELNDYGFRGIAVRAKDKRIIPGINRLRQHVLHLLPDSPNLEQEFSLYKWRMVAGEAQAVPIDKFNHLLDALRYVVMTFDHIGYHVR